MKGLKIAHFGNLANDAFPVVEALRKKGIDADLYVPFPQHVCSLPQWEVCSLEASEVGDPYDPDMNVLNKDFEQPPWLHFIYLPKKSSDLPRRWAVILNLMRKYDFIVAHVPFSIYAQFCHRPYVAFDAGAIRYFEI